MNKDLIIAKLQTLNEEKDKMIINLADQNETLENLITEVKNALKDFKRQFAGRQVLKLFKRLEGIQDIDTDRVKKSVVMYVANQRANRQGLHKIFRKYMDKQGYGKMEKKFELEQYAEFAFESFTTQSQDDANMALSVLSSMLVVLLDIEEAKAKEAVTEV